MSQCLSVQVYFQRVLSAKTTRFAEILSYMAGAGCLFMTIPAMLIGIIVTQTSMFLLNFFFFFFFYIFALLLTKHF
jgi:hypothetical protein